MRPCWILGAFAASCLGCYGYEGHVYADCEESLSFLSLRLYESAKPKKGSAKKSNAFYIDALGFRGKGSAYSYPTDGARCSVGGLRLKMGLEFPFEESADGRSAVGFAVGFVYAREIVRFTASGADGSAGATVELTGEAFLTPLLLCPPELFARMRLGQSSSLRFTATMAPLSASSGMGIEEMELAFDIQLNKNTALAVGWRSIGLVAEVRSPAGYSYDYYGGYGYYEYDSVRVSGSGFSIGLVVTY